MLDFFAQQEQAKRSMRLLLMLMVLAVLALSVALYLVSLPLAWQQAGWAEPRWWLPEWFALVMLGTAAFVGLVSGGRALLLRQGGGRQVAEMLGGRLLVQDDRRDSLDQRLLNVVEEMAIAAGVPVPMVFVLDGEPSINAFAAGYSLNDAVIAVTGGALRQLPREQLQGVIAHEFSHILHGDMRLNLRLIGIVFGIVCLSLVGRLLLEAGASRGMARRDRNDTSGIGLLVLGLGMLVIGMVGNLFGRLIQAAVSRQREYLADAAAVQFTRNPRGIADALRQIAGSVGSHIAAPRAAETRHLFFGDPMQHSLLHLFSTHPPLAERIRRLDAAGESKAPPMAGPAAPIAGVAAGVAGLAGHLPSAALPSAQHLLSSYPPALHEAAGHPLSASALIYALVCHSNATLRAHQLQAIEEHADRGQAQEVARLLPLVQALDRSQRLPLATLCAPTLRQLSVDQQHSLRRNLAALVDADATLDIFEYVLLQTVMHQLRGDARLAALRRPPLKSLKHASEECQVLFSAIAWAGRQDARLAQSAYAAAAARLADVLDTAAHPLLPWQPRLLAGLGAALERLANAPPSLRERLVDACVHGMLADSHVAIDEAELLRAICLQLDCPLPLVAAWPSGEPSA